MKSTTVKAEGYFEMKYDPKSEEFQIALSDYRESVDKTATEEDMIMNAAHQIRIGGADRMLEGIGYVKCRGRIIGEPYSGIEIVDDDPSFKYEID